MRRTISFLLITCACAAAACTHGTTVEPRAASAVAPATAPAGFRLVAALSDSPKKGETIPLIGNTFSPAHDVRIVATCQGTRNMALEVGPADKQEGQQPTTNAFAEMPNTVTCGTPMEGTLPIARIRTVAKGSDLFVGVADSGRPGLRFSVLIYERTT
jgi:hypothetical protein